jgi:two-component system OmpR family sensor kinase
MKNRRPWTLRRRLVLGIVALLALVSITIGTVSVLALRSSLLDKIDDQVTEAISRSQFFADDRGPGPREPDARGPGPGEILGGAGFEPGSLVVVSDGSTAAGAILEQGLEATYLPADTVRAVLDAPLGDEPSTIDLGELGSFRAAASEGADGSTRIIGLPLDDVTATVNHVLAVVIGVTLAGLVIAFFGGTAVVRVALRPLERVTATATHVSELPLDRGDVALEARVPDEDADPRTEVGQVGAAINRMLGHVASALTAREASEQKLRTFVADASHELRTPLASIRGYAELTRMVGHDLPPDVVHSMGRIESESVRMTSLVEDLLLLARLDDGRELEKAPVDISRILADAVSDAHAAGPDHEWVLDVPDEPILVPGDAARLTQVVVNLLGNARVHTPAGTRVVASAVRSSDAVTVTVTDDGPGISTEVLPTVFERFARGDSSRSRAAGSTGLGLAIVAAVVEAHDGTVDVASEPGRTTFTITLPASPGR